MRAWVTGCIAAMAVAGAVGCVETDTDDPAFSATSQASTVESYVANGCSSSVVIELSRQIAEEVDCMLPGQLVPLEEGNGIVFTGSAVLPYMSSEGRADLLRAAADGGEIQLNSAYRTVAQQYLLYRWYQAGRCGITAAATPGNSNHESGRAIDVNNWPERRNVLEANGWAQTVPGDEVHFDHLDSPDIRDSDVQAFQRLWNRNHPDDLIDEDGVYGPQTGARLAQAPAEGFPIGAQCDNGGGGDGGGGDPPADDPNLPGGGDGLGSGGDGSGGDPASLDGGCSAGGGGAGGAGGGVLVALGLLVARRRWS